MEFSLKFVGTGGAFDVAQGNSAAYVQLGDVSILIDCGHTVFPRLVQLGLAHRVDYLFLTHLHDDHAGSASTLAYYHHHVLQQPRLKVLVADPYQQLEIRSYLAYPMGEPEKYIEFVHVDHLPGVSAIDTYGQHVPAMRTYGLVLSHNGETLAYSGDIGCPDFFCNALRQRGLRHIRVYHDTCFFPGVATHAYHADLARHLGDFDLVGYHHNPAHAPADLQLPIATQLADLLL